MQDVPTLYNNDTFMCAKLWQGVGHEHHLNSCLDCDGGSAYDLIHNQI